MNGGILKATFRRILPQLIILGVVLLLNFAVFPGFFHIDLQGNVLPKLELLRQFGFYPEPQPADQNAESCGAHSPRIEAPELATRAER